MAPKIRSRTGIQAELLDIVRTNLHRIRHCKGSPTLMQMERATGIGYGTLQRLLGAEDSHDKSFPAMTTDTLAQIAAYAGAAPWMLMHPYFDPTIPGFIGAPPQLPLGRLRKPKVMPPDADPEEPPPTRFSRRPSSTKERS